MRIFQKYKTKIQDIFSQNLSNQEIILAVILGVFIGIMPVFGISTIIATYLAIKLKLNIGVTLFSTYAVSPIHPLLFIPFIHLGESIVGIEHTLLSFSAIKQAFSMNYIDALEKLWLEFLCGISGWSLISIPILFSVFYFTIKSKINAT